MATSVFNVFFLISIVYCCLIPEMVEDNYAAWSLTLVIGGCRDNRNHEDMLKEERLTSLQHSYKGNDRMCSCFPFVSVTDLHCTDKI